MTTADEPLAGFSPPVPLRLDAVDAAPSESGVHVVLDETGTAVYAGATGSLRRRLREHLQGDRQASVLHEQVGEFLDSQGHTATAEEIRDWLGGCTVRWRLTGNPRALTAQLVKPGTTVQ